MIPRFVFDSIFYLKETGTQYICLTLDAFNYIGLFRVSGNGNMMASIQTELDSGMQVNFFEIDFSNPHVVAGLLKQYFRDLPTSLFEESNHPKLIEIIGIM